MFKIIWIGGGSVEVISNEAKTLVESGRKNSVYRSKRSSRSVNCFGSTWAT